MCGTDILLKYPQPYWSMSRMHACMRQTHHTQTVQTHTNKEDGCMWTMADNGREGIQVYSFPTAKCCDVHFSQTNRRQMLWASDTQQMPSFSSDKLWSSGNIRLEYSHVRPLCCVWFYWKFLWEDNMRKLGCSEWLLGHFLMVAMQLLWWYEWDLRSWLIVVGKCYCF